MEVAVIGGGAWGSALYHALASKVAETHASGEVPRQAEKREESSATLAPSVYSESHEAGAVQANAETSKTAPCAKSLCVAEALSVSRDLESPQGIKSATTPSFSLPHFAVGLVSRTKREGVYQCSLKEALGARFLVLAIASGQVRGWLERAKLPRETKILAACKGIEEGSGALVSEILESFLPRENLAYLAGPSFAKEVRDSLPCALAIHSHNLALAEVMARHFPSWMRLYVDDDVIGGEIGGAYKNVIAIAGGVCDGLGLGSNAKASLIARGLVEMTRFGEFFGARGETFLGLSGAGDLFLTSSSTLSRNYRVGIGLAQGKSLETILIELGEVAEGIKTTHAVMQLARKHAIHTPIAREVEALLQGKNPRDSLRDLLIAGR